MDDNVRRLASRLPMTVIIVSVAGLLGACAGEDTQPAAKVASIAAPASAPVAGSTSAPAPPAGAAGKRPQLRIDSSLDDEFRLKQAWYACWKKAGAPVEVAGPDQVPDGVTARGQFLLPNFHKVGASTRDWKDDPAFARALKECADLEPIPAPDFNPATNPQFQDQYKAFILCLRSKGVKANPTDVAQPAGGHNHLSFEFADGADMPANLDAVASQCEAAAFK